MTTQTKTITGDNITSLLADLAHDRNRYGSYEIEELNDPEEDRCFQGMTLLLVDIIRCGYDSKSKGKTNQETLESIILPLVERCHQIKQEYRHSPDSSINIINFGELKKQFDICRTILMRIRRLSSEYLPDELEERISPMTALNFLYNA
ncbi:MAG: hypothetical protein H9W81_03345 [Enterococcus sp.]|nr:hypothetical protein [Enterococcus sp.]